MSSADITATLDLYDGLSPDVGTSMLKDHRPRRPHEHDLISGAVVRAAARHRLDAPLNRAVLALLAASSRPLRRGARPRREDKDGRTGRRS